MCSGWSISSAATAIPSCASIRSTDSCGQALVDRFQVDERALPIVLCPSGKLLRNPTEDQLARCIGLVGPIDPNKLFDVAIVGTGPAGWRRRSMRHPKGLSVLALDCRSFGGQAGASARIENYLGFPTGISGMALMGRAYSQAQKFGVEMAIPDEAVRLHCGNDPCKLELANGEQVQAKSIVIAIRRPLPAARRCQSPPVRGDFRPLLGFAA